MRVLKTAADLAASSVLILASAYLLCEVFKPDTLYMLRAIAMVIVASLTYQEYIDKQKRYHT